MESIDFLVAIVIGHTLLLYKNPNIFNYIQFIVNNKLDKYYSLEIKHKCWWFLVDIFSTGLTEHWERNEKIFSFAKIVWLWLGSGNS